MRPDDAIRIRHMIEAGEAAARVSEETRATTPNVPWVQIVGMRNRLIHAYFDIDHDSLWRTVANEIPALTAILEDILPE